MNNNEAVLKALKDEKSRLIAESRFLTGLDKAAYRRTIKQLKEKIAKLEGGVQ
jgi:hypothetical protein